MATYPYMDLYCFWFNYIDSFDYNSKINMIRNPETSLTEYKIWKNRMDFKELLPEIKNEDILLQVDRNFDCRATLLDSYDSLKRFFNELSYIIGGINYYKIFIHKNISKDYIDYLNHIIKDYTYDKNLEIIKENNGVVLLIKGNILCSQISFYLFMINHINDKLCVIENNIVNIEKTSENILINSLEKPQNILSRGEYEIDVVLSLFNVYLITTTVRKVEKYFYNTCISNNSNGISNFYRKILNENRIDVHLMKDFIIYIQTYVYKTNYSYLYFRNWVSSINTSYDVENIIKKTLMGE